jgi:hypothetical protein
MYLTKHFLFQMFQAQPFLCPIVLGMTPIGLEYRDRTSNVFFPPRGFVLFT